MQFNITSDYAIRIVLYLAMNKDRICTAAEIEEKMGVPLLYLYKITRKLREAGFIRTIQGVSGGYRINRDPKDINLFEILSTTEQSMLINGCIADIKYCSRNATETCNVRKVFCGLSKYIEEKLKEATIQSLIDDIDNEECSIECISENKQNL